MTERETVEKKSTIEQIRAVVDSAPESIREEYKATDNSWLEALITKAGTIQLLLSVGLRDGEIAESKVQNAREKLSSLRDKIRRLQNEYPRGGKEVLDALKEELISDLASVAEDL